MINLVLSTEKLNDYQVCPWLYWLKHETRLTPIKKAVYFEEGELMHEILRMYYQDKIDRKNSPWHMFLDLGRNYAAKNLQLSSEEVESAIADARMYFEYYAGNESWEILGAEEPFAKILAEVGDFRIVVNGKSDLRVKTNHGKGELTIVDHKYEGRFNAKHERDNQPLCYSWAFETEQFIYNRIGKARSKNTKVDDKLIRPVLNFAKYQIEDWKESVIKTAEEIIWRYQNNSFPQHYHGCTVGGNKCTFYDLCNTTANNREYKQSSLFKIREEKLNVMDGHNEKTSNKTS